MACAGKTVEQWKRPAESTGDGRKQWAFHGPPKQKVPKIPRCRDLLAGPAAIARPSNEVLVKFKPCTMIAAINVETHILVSGNTKSWRSGRFGLLTTVADEDIESLRIVRIGWATGARDDRPQVQDVLVKPDGFCISAEAAKNHKVQHDYAAAHGHTLSKVLTEMMEDVLSCCARGGILVAHHLAFDAGVIACELDRSGLVHLINPWCKAVQSGLCTMDPDIACWVRGMIGMREIPRSIPMRLLDMVKATVADSETLCGDYHSVGNVARMHFLLCNALYARCDAYAGKHMEGV